MATDATPDNDIYYYDHEISSLSHRQEKIISILPIPSAILSILGSVTIICMAYQTRRFKVWSTYTRLLVAMSLNDILFSTSFSMNAFLLPAESSQRVWAFGTDATCSAMGFFLQFSSSGILYNGMLSFYFLLTARYRVSKRTMARYIEPVMHFISLGFPFATALSGLILGVYHETELGQSCWVANYPENCGEAPGETGEPCKSTMMGYIFGAIGVGFTLLSLFFNNIAILFFVRRQVLPALLSNSSTTPSGTTTSGEWRRTTQRILQNTTRKIWTKMPSRRTLLIADGGSASSEERSLSSDTSMSGRGEQQDPEVVVRLDVETPEPETSRIVDEKERVAARIDLDDESYHDDISKELHDPSQKVSTKDQHDQQQDPLRKEQLERLKLVASQSYLYVLAFLLSMSWPVMLRILESLNFNKENEHKVYPLLILQSTLVPLQGLFNLCVFVRPRYLKCRKEFPEESRLFAFRRAIHGDKVKSTVERQNNKERMAAAGAGGTDDHNNVMKKTPNNCCPHCAGTGVDKIRGEGPAVVLPRETVDTMAGNSSTWERPTKEAEECDTTPLPSLEPIPSTGSSDSKKIEGSLRGNKDLKHGENTPTHSPESNNPATLDEQKAGSGMTSSAAGASATVSSCCSRPLPRNMLSSLTTSQGDFSIVELEEHHHHHDHPDGQPTTSQPPLSSSREPTPEPSAQRQAGDILYEGDEMVVSLADNAKTTRWSAGTIRRLSGVAMSSLTASLGDFSIAEEVEEGYDEGREEDPKNVDTGVMLSATKDEVTRRWDAGALLEGAPPHKHSSNNRRHHHHRHDHHQALPVTGIDENTKGEETVANASESVEVERHAVSLLPGLATTNGTHQPVTDSSSISTGSSSTRAKRVRFHASVHPPSSPQKTIRSFTLRDIMNAKSDDDEQSSSGELDLSYDRINGICSSSNTASVNTPLRIPTRRLSYSGNDGK